MQQEVTGDSGYYILYNSKNLNSYTLTKFKEMFFSIVGDTVNDLRISGIINDSDTSLVNECSNLIKNSTFLGIGDTNSINSAFSIILTRDLSTKLSENIFENIEDSYINPATYEMFEFYSLFTNYDLNDLLDIKLNGQKVNFTYNFISDSKVFFSIYIPEFYFDKLDEIKVTVLNKTMPLKEFYNLFILEDDSPSINDINLKVF